ncbi:DUF6943 family protein [Aequorivita marina]|uniref:DUF6943 family protein n=1 Tax=Aequorivita marina TaxID=3073654 RepID=UPI0028771538|nr:hypothetical protein [Aequorivita sp. S2608]MDS1299202.1 hypothetical protein [Aequorivita sp. S2608]
MKAFKIKTHKPGKTYCSPHFFILNKGKNAGRPSRCSFSNSFVVFTNTQKKAHQLYWICNILFHGYYFKTYFSGSVIPFIHIGQVNSLLKKMIKNYEGHHWNGRFNALEELEHLSTHLLHQQRCLEEYKIALLKSYNLNRE